MKSRVTWDAVAGAAGYKLTVQSWDTANLRWSGPFGPMNPTSGVEVTVLPNTKYRHTLQALNVDGTTIRESPPVSIEFTTPPITGAPDSPENLAQEIIQ